MNEREPYVPPVYIKGDFPDEPHSALWGPHYAVAANDVKPVRDTLDFLWWERCIRMEWITRHEDEAQVYFGMPRYTVERNDGFPTTEAALRLPAGKSVITRETYFTLRRADTGE